MSSNLSQVDRYSTFFEGKTDRVRQTSVTGYGYAILFFIVTYD